MVSSEILAEVFIKFVDNLRNRFSKQVYTTEDSIRYTFFHSLVELGGISPSQMILEQPHPKIPRAEIDAFVPDEKLVFEFKYDRTIPSGKNLPRPMKAGKTFADLFRLSTFVTGENLRRFFVYVTDGEMFSYYQNKNNRLYDFFNLAPKTQLVIDEKYVNKHCKTFIKSTGTNLTSCKIESQLSTNIRNQLWIKIYEVFSI